MTEFFQWFTEVLLGKPGRYMLEFIGNHIFAFFGVAVLYGFLLTYARFILKKYLPKKLDEHISHRWPALEGNKKQAAAVINEEWEQILANMPWYIVVPTTNELWIKAPNINYRLTKQLPFRKEKSTLSEYEWIYNNLAQKEEA